MQDGFILLYEKKENEQSYSYAKYYNPVEVLVSYSDYEFENYSLCVDNTEIKICSYEEYYNFNDIVLPQINNLTEKLLLYYTKLDGFSLYNCTDKNNYFVDEDSQSEIKEQLYEIMIEKCLCK
jgi:hypothetical protein